MPELKNGVYHYSQVETSKLIKQELTANFKGVKFSVKKNRSTWSTYLSVRWEDGPSKHHVEAFLEQFREGRNTTRDSMSDYAGHVSAEPVYYKGKACQFDVGGYDGLPSCDRTVSEDFITIIGRYMASHYGNLDYQEVNGQMQFVYTGSDSYMNSRSEWNTRAWRMYQYVDANLLPGTTTATPDSVALTQYKGNDILSIPTTGKPFNIGRKKAQCLHDHRDQLAAFVAGNHDGLTLSEYKGHMILELPDIRLGQSKAQATLDHFEALSAFVHEADELPATESPAPPELPADFFTLFDRPAQAAKLRELASGLDDNIHDKLNPATADQNWTRRRASIIDSMKQDAHQLQRVQAILNALADEVEKEYPFLNMLNNPEAYSIALRLALYSIKHRSEIETLVTYGSLPRFPSDHARRMARLGITTNQLFQNLRRALFGMIEQVDIGESETEKSLNSLYNKVLGQQPPGFFPTPDSVVDMMLTRANIRAGNTVLEPSAGLGHIADKVRQEHPDNPLTLRETHWTMCEYLKLNGYENVQHCDTLAKNTLHGTFDRILMNPPFEKLADIEHVQHAYKLLNTGGILVAIMSAGPFFRDIDKAQEFRDWLDDLGADYEPLPEGTFLDSKRPTGVRTYIVTIARPDNDTPPPADPEPTDESEPPSTTIPQLICVDCGVSMTDEENCTHGHSKTCKNCMKSVTAFTTILQSLADLTPKHREELKTLLGIRTISLN